MSGPYRMVRPCQKCPFRVDVDPYLRPERAAEIARTITMGGEFFCHETTVPDPDDDSAMMANDGSLVCAGSVLTMLRGEEENQMLRIAERIGMFDRERVSAEARSLVSRSLLEWQNRFRGEDDDEEGEPCGIVGPYCEAPAGYAIGGSVVNGTETTEYQCEDCGTPVCTACSKEIERSGAFVRLCDDCLEVNV